MAEINLSPYTAESEAIARKLRMAEALNQQAMQPIELPQQPGVKVSHYAGLAKMLQAYNAAMTEKEARQEAKDLAENYRRQGQSEVGSFLEAIQGTPAQAAIPASIVQNATGADAADNPNLQIMGGQGLAPEVPAQAAVGPDMKKALAVALGAQANPTIQAAGGALLSSTLTKNLQSQDFQNILKAAGLTPPVVSQSPAIAGQVPPVANQAPQGAAPQANNAVAPNATMQTSGYTPFNNLNPNILAMSGNPQAMELAKFIQQNQPEFGTKPEIFQKPDGTLMERVYGKRGEVIDRPLTATPYEKPPEINRSVTDAIVASGIDPKSAEGKKIYRELVAKQTSHPQGTSVKIDNKMGEGVAAQIGPMMKDSLDVATGAVKQVDASQRVIFAIDKGQIIAGPLAGGRVTLAQMGQALGVGGADAKEQLANTRQVIRGLAEMTLQGRSQMKGQGAITESEGLLAEKANSGRIEDLTVPEIKQLALASERAARFAHAEHERKYLEMANNPTTSSLATYYKGPAMPPPITAQPPAAAKPSGGTWKVVK